MQLHEVTLRSGVTKVCLTPRKPFVAVASLKSGPPVVVDLSHEQPTVTALDSIDLTGNRQLSAPQHHHIIYIITLHCAYSNKSTQGQIRYTPDQEP